jgi:hypothetical protein
MLTEIRATLRRCAPTMAEDAAGVAALALLLTAGLYLPMFI